MELLCPAGSLPALKTAIDNGADAVYIGFKDDTNARHFAGLNFDDKKLQRAVEYVHQHQRKLHIAINTFAHPGSAARWQAAVDRGVELGADALIIADIAVLDYTRQRYPEQEIHYRFRHQQPTALQCVFTKKISTSSVLCCLGCYPCIRFDNCRGKQTYRWKYSRLVACALWQKVAVTSLPT